MEQLIASFPHRPLAPMVPPGLGNPPGQLPFPPVPFGGSNFPPNRPQLQAYSLEQDQKRKEFAKGIFVTGFQKSVTTAMIQHHFNIKPINALKHPITKFKQSKCFAFIYYGSEDDAIYVKNKLDGSAILKSKIKITRTVISENLSKMIFKMKTHGFSEKEVVENQEKYFYDENLLKQVERIIKPLFGSSVQVNKIAIPHSKSSNKPLRYARILFYLNDIKQAKNVADKINSELEQQNTYQKILTCICNKLNEDQIFSKYVKSQLYQYSNRKRSNILHLMGIRLRPEEKLEVLNQEIKDFMEKLGYQWNILNVYGSLFKDKGAWANVTFSNWQQAQQAYNHLKNTKIKFRDQVIYGSVMNMKDKRTVVISKVKQDATEQDMNKFLKELVALSVKRLDPMKGQLVVKYDYFSFSIIQQRQVYLGDGDAVINITKNDDEKKQVQPYYRESRVIPRRLVIHFFQELKDSDIKQLCQDIQFLPNYNNIFTQDLIRCRLKANHQKGHYTQDNVYVEHYQPIVKKKNRNHNREKRQPRRNMEGNHSKIPNRFSQPFDFNLGALPIKSGAPKLPPNLNQNPFKPLPIGHTGPNPFLVNRPPQQFSGVNIPPPPFPFNKPPNFLPPGAPNPPGMIPPPPVMPPGMLAKGMPPMPTQWPFKPIAMPPTSAQTPAKE